MVGAVVDGAPPTAGDADTEAEGAGVAAGGVDSLGL